MPLASMAPRATHRITLTITTLGVTLYTTLALPLAAQESAPDAAAELRRLYFLRDYEGGAAKGELWLEQAPEDTEARAWYVMHLARNRKVDQALEIAEAMIQSQPEDPWSLFALAGALNWHDERGKEALEPSAQALQAKHGDFDFAWLRADVVRKQDGNEAAIRFIDSLPQEMKSHPDMLVRKGVALHYLWNDLEEAEKEARKDESYAVFEEARVLDSTNVEAHYLPGAYYFSAGQREAATALMKRAARLTPSPEVHQWYWRALRADTQASREEKRAAIEADIEFLCTSFDEAPGTLQAIAGVYGELNLDQEQREFEERVLNGYPTSDAAEWVLVNRYRALRREIYEAEQAGGMTDSTKVEQLREMLVAFIDRPQHNQKTLLGDAYRELFRIVKDDPDVDGEYLYALVNGMVQYEGINVHIAYGDGALALAEQETHLDYAEQIAKQGIEKADETIREQNERGVYDTEEEFQRGLGWYTGIMYDALGWVYFHAGRLEEAEEQLTHAHELNKENLTNLHHLGQYHEFRAEQASGVNDAAAAEHHLDEAEGFYIKGVMVQSFGDNPNDEALKTLYVKRNGSDAGYEAYLADAEHFDRKRRQEKVIGELVQEPEMVAPFSLKTLDGSTVAYEDLAGKIVVVNFWGVWCGPCVIEMPEIQKFHDSYTDDPDVVFVAIDYQDDADDVRDWIARREYTFPVLLDDGYVSEVGVNAFPTTWFIDRDGHIRFTKRGASEKLVEEFTWRVEALKEGGR